MATIKLRTGTTSQWAAANPVLALGEPGYDSDTHVLKIGDGATKWSGLKGYLNEVTSTAKYAPAAQRVNHAPALGLWFPEAEGAVGDGVADDAAALSACIAASVAGRGRTSLRPGATYKCESPVALATNADIRGEGPAGLTKVAAGAQLTATAIFLGTSGTKVARIHLTGFTIDGAYSTHHNRISGIQITNGQAPVVEGMHLRDFGLSAVVCQGLNLGGGTPGAVVRGNTIVGTGQADGTTGHAITIKDASPRCQVTENSITDAKGGMGIALYGSTGTGYPTDCVVSLNTIAMAKSTTGFECIGIAAGCVGTTITGNSCLDSQDNGISITPDRCTVAGNYIAQAVNHGIASAGAHSTITGNVIRNVGLARVGDGSDYGGISLAGASYNSVTGNTIVDDQATPTMAIGIKLLASAGHNVLIGNNIRGGIGAAYGPAHATDQIVDHNAFDNGPYIPKLHLDTLLAGAGSNLLIASPTRAQSQFFVGSTGSGDGQLNVHSNTTKRPSIVSVRVAGQVSDLYQGVHEDASTVLFAVSRTGRVTGADGITTRYIAGTGRTSASDGDFAMAPPDGTVAVVTDTSDGSVRFSIRAGGTWKTTAALS